MKSDGTIDTSSNLYPKTRAEQIIDGNQVFQDKLVSGENIKTINGESVLGSGNISISGGDDAVPYEGATQNVNLGAHDITANHFVTYDGRIYSGTYTVLDGYVLNYPMGVTSTLATEKYVNDNAQAKLVSGENIKTVGGQTLLGTGNIDIPVTSVKINGTSIVSNKEANIVTETAYNSSTNKIATMSDVNSALSNIYQLQGTAAVNYLNSISKTSTMNGYVYSIETGSSGNLTNQNGTTLAVIAGDSVVLIWNGGSWRWDKLSSGIDTSNFVTYTGATGNVNLNGHNLTAEEVSADVLKLNDNGSDSGAYISPNGLGSGGLTICGYNDTVYLVNGSGEESWLKLRPTGIYYNGDYTNPNSEIATKGDIPNVSGLVPYTGATGDINLGLHKIKSNTFETYDGTIYGGTYISFGGNYVLSYPLNVTGTLATEDYVDNAVADIDLSGLATESYVNNAISSAIANVYQLKGSRTVNYLNDLTKSSDLNGYVYNVETSGTLTGNRYSTSVKAGDNVVFIWDNGSWYWDRLSSIDGNNIVTKDDAQVITGNKTFSGNNTFSGSNTFSGRINPNANGYGLVFPNTSSFTSTQTLVTTETVVDLSSYQEITGTKVFSPTLGTTWFRTISPNTGDKYDIGDENHSWKNLYLTGTINKNVSFHKGLVLPDTSGWQEDRTVATSDLIASEYDSTQTYNTGDVVLHNGDLYMCKNDNVTGTWTSGNWQKGNLVSLILGLINTGI